MPVGTIVLDRDRGNVLRDLKAAAALLVAADAAGVRFHFTSVDL